MIDFTQNKYQISYIFLYQFSIYCSSIRNIDLMNKKTNSLMTIIFILWTIDAHLIEIQNIQPHQKQCYSQGLFFYNDTHLFQTCGLYNESFFQVLEYKSNPFQITRTYKSQKPWKSNIFMQGAIKFNNYLYILTWRESVVYKLDTCTFEVLEQLKWKRDGWGLTQNGTHMFTTDGSNNIYLVDQDFKLLEIKPIVNKLGRKIYNINQLEYVNGFIYANIYFDTKIVKIDYERGKVVEEYDGSGLVRAEKSDKNNKLKSDQVINGIAYDKLNDKFILTGKRWKSYYQVQI